jgi:hypothetical protein
MASIVLPSFARCQSPAHLKRRYFQIVAGFVCLGLGLITLSLFFPSELLWILGGKYRHLEKEVILIMIASALNSVGSAIWWLNASKAWIKHSWLNIPSTIVTQIFLLLILDMTTVNGVLLFSIISMFPPFLINLMLSYQGLYKGELLHSE